MNSPHRRSRRGMLLLLVLSMLTLFLLLGTTFLVLATRARTASRAFMAATSDIEASPSLPRALLDEALLMLIRGSQDPAVRGSQNPAVEAAMPDTLLRDVYEVNGNRSPFRDQAFDAFGKNPADNRRYDAFLTEVDAGVVKYAAFGDHNPPRPVEVDNDADGTADGVWLPKLLPSTTSTKGGKLTFRVSYLVLDLDGRINVNAHGGGSGAADAMDSTKPVGPADIEPPVDEDGNPTEPFDNDGWTKIQSGGPTNNPPAGGKRRPPSLHPTRTIVGRGGQPYALALDSQTARSGSLVTAAPYSLGELERLLRPFDRDWPTLPPRLSAFVTDLDETARRLVTTDSWDVTCKTGEAAQGQTQPAARFDLSSSPGNKLAFAQGLYAAISGVAGANAATAQWVANVTEFREPLAAPQGMTLGGSTVTGVSPSVLGGRAGPWNGGFTSVADLLAVPVGTKEQIESILNQPLPTTPLRSLVATKPEILDQVYVPSRFTAVADKSREPGRVNVNTCEDAVWQVVCKGGPPGRPGRPYQTMWDLLKNVARGDQDIRMDQPLHLDRGLANRLAAMATIRSNVFAIWITLEVTDSAPDAGPPTCHRMFAIVDRSIPVDYQEGRTTDVRKTIRLQRFLN